jgi:hypothetical protein
MPDWSIKFVPAKNPTPDQLADFVLDVPGDPAGPFEVFNGDIISWNNTTRDDHQPAVYDPGPPPATTPTPIGDTLNTRKSSPGFGISASAGTTINFCCTLHSGEVGTIVVVNPGQSTPTS